MGWSMPEEPCMTDVMRLLCFPPQNHSRAPLAWFWCLVFCYTVGTALLIQLVALPYLFPFVPRPLFHYRVSSIGMLLACSNQLHGEL